MNRIWAKKAPYYNTKVSMEKSKTEIDIILRKYGVTKIAWDFDPEHDLVELHFQFEEEINGQTVTPVIKIKPPEIWKTVRGYSKKHQRYIKGDTINWPQSLRCLYWYIKTHLEMTKLGHPKTQEFLPHLTIPLPNNTETTIGQILLPRLNQLKKIAMKTSEIPLLQRVEPANG